MFGHKIRGSSPKCLDCIRKQISTTESIRTYVIGKTNGISKSWKVQYTRIIGNNFFDSLFDLFVRKGGEKRKELTSISYVVSLESLISKNGNKSVK